MERLLVDLEVVALPYAEATVFCLACAIEQATLHRQAPKFLN
jgi:hypothetical protein